MIRRLRYKLIAVTMTSISLLFILILGVINISMTVSAKRQGYDLLERIAQPPVPFMEEENREMPFSPFRHRPPDSYQENLRIFSVTFDEHGAVNHMDFNEKSDLTEEQILELGKKAIEEYNHTSREQGSVSSYLYRVSDIGPKQVYFLDYTLERSLMSQLFNLCLLAGLIGIAILFAAVWLLSGWMIKPVQNAFDKQKQFIADASHELKTPLTIINANAEVLAGTHQKDRWIENILEQTGRMNALIRDLLELARMDAYEQKDTFHPFDLSRCVSAAALSFESLAFESQKTFDISVAENFSLKGNEEKIRQLVTILLDNAFKYSDENGKVSLILAAKGEKKLLSVYNTGKGISEKDQPHIFERFYRCDNSRSRESGGYGLGLSIAANIVKNHHGHISVKSDGESYTLITVIL